MTRRHASVPASLHSRSTLPSTTATMRSHYHNSLSLYLSFTSVDLLSAPRIVSPHVGAVTALDVDNTAEGRFLLSGGRDGTVCVYDLNELLGSSHALCSSPFHDDTNATSSSSVPSTTRSSRQTFLPVARSSRSSPAPNNNRSHPTFLPTGHSYSLSALQWYPVDSGAFLSADSGGAILVWDTNSFTPVSVLQVPSCAVQCADMPRNHNARHLLLALGCRSLHTTTTTNTTIERGTRMVEDRVVRLCDITSGSISHELVGHGKGGVNAIQWCPTNEFILASGGEDGTIRMWDIRKSGSGSCLFLLDQSRKENGSIQDNSIRNGYHVFRNHNNDDDDDDDDVGYHLAKRWKRESSKITKHEGVMMSPSDYSNVENIPVESHGGGSPVAALSFSPDGCYLVSVGGWKDDQIHAWDVRPGSNGILLPTVFTTSSNSNNNNGVMNSKQQRKTKKKKVALTITQPGSSNTASIWIGRSSNNDDVGSGELVGYNLHGMGGNPEKVLVGHLDCITSITTQDTNFRLFTGGSEGMILGWGRRNSIVETV